MTTKRPDDLTPLLEDSSQSPFMRELLEAGRDASVAGYDFDRGLSKHMALVETGAPMPHWAQGLRPAAGATGGAAAGSSILAWLAVPLALAALTSAVVLVSKQAPAPAAVTGHAPSTPQALAPQQAAVPATARATTAQAKPAANVPGSNLAQRPVHAPLANSGTAPAVRGGASFVAAPVARTPHAKRGELKPQPVLPTTTIANGATNAKSAAQPATSELFETAQPVAARASQPVAAPAQQVAKPEQEAARPQVPAQPVAQDDARLEREMAMLAVAQRVLLSDPARALNLARQGESEFAGSMFTQERQQIVLLSLVKLGRMDEAKRLAKPYLGRYPHGPFSDRVRLALATGKVDR